jgi:hypothetical protein
MAVEQKANINRPIGGHHAEWTQLDSTPHYLTPQKEKLA